MTIKINYLDCVSDDLINILNKQASFFSSWSWYRLLINTAITQDDCFFLAYEDNAIILPVRYNNIRYCRLLMSLTNFYSPLYHIVYKTSSEQSIRQLGAFFKELTIPWDVLQLQPMSQDDAMSVVNQLKAAKIPAISFFCFGNWYLDVKGRCYDDYFAGLASQVKNTVIRKTKKFNAIPHAKLVIVSSEQDLDTAIPAYNRVYKASWKTEEAYPEFIAGLCRLAAEQGALRLGLAYINNIAVAAQLWIVADNTAYIYKLAYDEAYKNYGIGSVLTAKLMQHVIDVDKVATVDYLTGDDAYKKDWMSHRRERWGILAFNMATFRGVLALSIEFSKRYIKIIWNALNSLLRAQVYTAR